VGKVRRSAGSLESWWGGFCFGYLSFKAFHFADLYHHEYRESCFSGTCCMLRLECSHPDLLDRPRYRAAAVETRKQNMPNTRLRTLKESNGKK